MISSSRLPTGMSGDDGRCVSDCLVGSRSVVPDSLDSSGTTRSAASVGPPSPTRRRHRRTPSSGCDAASRPTSRGINALVVSTQRSSSIPITSTPRSIESAAARRARASPATRCHATRSVSSIARRRDRPSSVALTRPTASKPRRRRRVLMGRIVVATAAGAQTTSERGGTDDREGRRGSRGFQV